MLLRFIIDFIRNRLSRGIIFCVLLSSCHSKDGHLSQWNYLVEQEGSYVAITIPKGDYGQDEINIFLEDIAIPQPVLGTMEESDSSYIFKPIVPLTPGNSYVIVYKNDTIAHVMIPNYTNDSAPKIVHVYPSNDTLPENLLKMYLLFNQPMSYQHSLDYVVLLEEGDTVEAFLDLQNELWNHDHTLLTLWLDPGRIKRDLVPNREKGNPLKENKQYQLVIKSDWKDAKGISLKESFVKEFFVSKRDTKSPDPDLWNIHYAKEEQTLHIQFNEALDYSLLKESFEIMDAHNMVIRGDFQVLNNESLLLFKPVTSFPRGSYRLKVSTILEDLAGNNLNRLFDREIKAGETVSAEPYFFINFRIE